MSLPHKISIACLSFASALFFSGCSDSLGPSASGTEVGNPEIQACARALMKIAGDDSAWRIGRYLDEPLLDPADNSQPFTLAKRAQTVPIDSCAVQVIDTSIITDTSLVPDTLHITDTLVEKRLQADTVTSIIEGDTLVTVNSSWVWDTILVSDSVVVQREQITIDTIFTRDTVYDCTRENVNLVNTVPNDRQLVLLGPAPEYDSMTYFPENDSVTLAFSTAAPGGEPVTARNVEVNRGLLLETFSVSKTVSAGDGAQGFATYTDSDGDGIIYTAAADALPAVLLEVRMQGNGIRSSLVSEFNAGADLSFTGTGDNHIISLDRRDSIEGAAFRTARLISLTSPESDTLLVYENSLDPADSLHRTESRYILTGEDGIGSLSLAGIHQTLEYAGADFTQIHITAIPDIPVSTSVGERVFSFTAEVLGPLGSVLLFTGTVEADKGVTGQFQLDGKTYTVTADAVAVIIQELP
ncbi:hypothetical protein ACFL5V_09815 [Fibrobacterota bacterium]